MADEKEIVGTWFKRIEAGERVRKQWEENYRVAECYNYWRGNQRKETHDEQGQRRAIHNKIHPDVAGSLPSLYFNRPSGKVMAKASRSDTSHETVTAKAQLLQDTGDFIIADPDTGFDENTFLATKESHWAVGCVEVGYSPDFINNPMAMPPPLQENEDTKISTAPVKDEDGLTVDGMSDLPALKKELKRLQENLRGEVFFVKHIRAEQLIISSSDKAILENNDSVGYWEEYPLEDVKNASAYTNTDDLKPSADGKEKGKEGVDDGSIEKVRLYKIWDLRTRVKYVFARGHEKILMKKKFKRCSLKFLRFDVDPYHFFPIPPVFLKLNQQDSYNDSAEYLRMMRVGTVPRFTYDEDAVDAAEAAKFQSSDFNIMIPRKQGTHGVIEAIGQPSTSSGAVQTLGLSEKEFAEAGNAGGDPRLPQTRTATQAMIADTKANAQDSFERTQTAKWLASIIQELILLATEYMNLPRWIAINVDMDSPDAQEAAQDVAHTYQQISAEKLREVMTGITWWVEVSVESLSPIADAERGAKIMQMVQFVSPPPVAALLSMAPTLLKQILSLSGLKNGNDIAAVREALAVIVQMNQQAAAAGAPPGPGISPQAKPTSPLPGPKGGPQPAAAGTPGKPNGPVNPPAIIPHPQPVGVQ